MIVDHKIKKQVIGGYLIDGDVSGVKLGTSNKPNLIRRIFVFLLLGWKWVDIEKIKER